MLQHHEVWADTQDNLLPVVLECGGCYWLCFFIQVEYEGKPNGFVFCFYLCPEDKGKEEGLLSVQPSNLFVWNSIKTCIIFLFFYFIFLLRTFLGLSELGLSDQMGSLIINTFQKIQGQREFGRFSNVTQRLGLVWSLQLTPQECESTLRHILALCLRRW